MFIPCNRHLHVEELATNSGGDSSVVLVPDGVRVKPQFSLVKLISVAHDCEKFNGQVGHTLVVNSNMLQEIKIGEQTYSVILENHVVGLVNTEQA